LFRLLSAIFLDYDSSIGNFEVREREFFKKNNAPDLLIRYHFLNKQREIILESDYLDPIFSG